MPHSKARPNVHEGMSMRGSRCLGEKRLMRGKDGHFLLQAQGPSSSRSGPPMPPHHHPQGRQQQRQVPQKQKQEGGQGSGSNAVAST